MTSAFIAGLEAGSVSEKESKPVVRMIDQILYGQFGMGEALLSRLAQNERDGNSLESKNGKLSDRDTVLLLRRKKKIQDLFGMIAESLMTKEDKEVAKWLLPALDERLPQVSEEELSKAEYSLKMTAIVTGLEERIDFYLDSAVESIHKDIFDFLPTDEGKEFPELFEHFQQEKVRLLAELQKSLKPREKNFTDRVGDELRDLKDSALAKLETVGLTPEWYMYSQALRDNLAGKATSFIITDESGAQVDWYQRLSDIRATLIQEERDLRGVRVA